MQRMLSLRLATSAVVMMLINSTAWGHAGGAVSDPLYAEVTVVVLETRKTADAKLKGQR